MSINLGGTTEYIKEIFSYISFPICLFKHALINLNLCLSKFNDNISVSGLWSISMSRFVSGNIL